TKSFGGLAALSELDLVIERGTVHALIGPNGSGKTTFLDLVSGLRRPEAGTVELAGQAIGQESAARRNRLGMARTFQNSQLFRPRAAAARRAGGGDEPLRDARAQRSGPAGARRRGDGAARRAPHGPGHGPVGRGDGSRLRPQAGRGSARGGPSGSPRGGRLPG